MDDYPEASRDGARDVIEKVIADAVEYLNNIRRTAQLMVRLWIQHIIDSGEDTSILNDILCSGSYISKNVDESTMKRKLNPRIMVVLFSGKAYYYTFRMENLVPSIVALTPLSNLFKIRRSRLAEMLNLI